MIILFIEILIVCILAMTLSTVIFDERKSRKRSMRIIKLKGYWDGSERRSIDRMNVTLEVKYAVNGSTVGTKGVDISTKGIRLILDEKFEKNTPLRLEIRLPDQTRLIKASGDVVWANESLEDEKIAAKRLFNTGIQFSRFHANDEKRLFDFIHGLPPQNPKQ